MQRLTGDDRRCIEPKPAAGTAYQVLGKQRNVTGPLAEWWDVDLDNA
jgi:hypothetical protein